MAEQNFYSKQTFLASLVQQLCAGTVRIYIPGITKEDDGEYTYIDGFLSEEFTLSLGNTWGSVLPDAESANQIGQILGLQSQITWIQASATAWKSTQPLEFELEVYLITLTPDQAPILDSAKQLMKLATLCVEDDDWATARIHGGYHVDYATSNNDIWSTGNWTLRNQDGKVKSVDASQQGAYASDIKSIAGLFGAGNANDPTGTVRILLNNKMLISNLLVNKISVTPSAAYVDPLTPLYIKLSIAFRSSRALLTKDIDNMLVEGVFQQ